MPSRPSLKRAVEWIAYNDEPGDLEVESVSDFISTLLTADLFGVSPEHVARKIVALRASGLTYD